MTQGLSSLDDKYLKIMMNKKEKYTKPSNPTGAIDIFRVGFSGAFPTKKKQRKFVPPNRPGTPDRRQVSHISGAGNQISKHSNGPQVEEREIL